MLRTKRGGKEGRSGVGNGDKEEIGGEELMRMSALAAASLSESSGGNVDPKLLDDLQDFLPMLESFLDGDRKASSCFTRKGKIVYTKTPTKDSVLKKVNDKKGRHMSQSIPTRAIACSILGESNEKEDDTADSSSTLSQRAIEAEKIKEEISVLNNQIEGLRQKLLEKEELISVAEISRNQLTSAQEKLKEVQYQFREKDSLLKSFERQVSDAKIKLGEKQAVLEKLKREAAMSNNQVEKLQEDLKTAELEMSAFNILTEVLKDDTDECTESNDLIPQLLINTPVLHDIDELDLQKMEEARKAYMTAVAAAKEYQDEESLVAAASARFHLQSFVMSA